jgi:polyisoprenoid-binding protein YceI
MKILLAGLCLALAAAAAAQEIVLGPGSVLWLEGDSTLHAYSSTATEVRVSGKWKEALGAEQFELEVPVRGLKSGKAKLDENMYEALNAGAHPVIRFELGDVRVGEDMALQALGTLSLAGVRRPVELHAKGIRRDGSLRVRGSKTLLMTDFGVNPPVMMLGTLRTRDKVTVHFDIFLEEGENK